VTRALLVCPEPLGHGQPAGIGIRFLEMAKLLGEDGHEVVLLDRQVITAEALQRESARCEVAVVQGHVANDLFAHARPIPTVVDLYDPFIIENLHYYPTRGGEVFGHDHATLLRSLARGDIFLCASEAQRLFYLGMLLAIGRVNPVTFADDAGFDALVRVAPFGVEAPRPLAPRDLTAPAVLFGGIYDWYDPILAIDAVALARQSLPGLTLTFTTHPNPELTPQGALADALAHVKRQRAEDFVRFVPWVSYGGRGAFFDRFAAALLTFPQSIETSLAMRTRIYDYLWGGLPVVTSSAPGTDEILQRYGAGRVVRSSSAGDLAAALVRLLTTDYSATATATQRFAVENQWRHTLSPLLDFVRAPRVDERKELFASPVSVSAPPPTLAERIRRRMGGRA
jgi:glycosyltransferase involved in cell wall biosynthesis